MGGQCSRAAAAQPQDPNPRHRISLGLSFLHMESENNNRITGLLGESNELAHGKCTIRQWRLASHGKKGWKKKQIPPLSGRRSNPLQRLSDKHWRLLTASAGKVCSWGSLTEGLCESEWNIWRFSLHVSLTWENQHPPCLLAPWHQQNIPNGPLMLGSAHPQSGLTGRLPEREPKPSSLHRYLLAPH